MKTGVLLLWTVCFLSIALSVLRFVWAASVQERILTLALALLAAGSARDKS